MFTPNSSNQNDFLRKFGVKQFCPLYLWAKYEPIGIYVTAQTVILGAKLHFKANTISQNALFSSSRVGFTEYI